MDQRHPQPSPRCSSALALALVAGLCALAAAPAAQAQAPVYGSDDVVPGEALVRFESGTSRSERAAVRRAVDAEFESNLDLPRTQLVSFDGSVEQAVKRLDRLDDVEVAQPNYRYHSLSTDLYYSSLWGLQNNSYPGIDTNVQSAWPVTRGAGTTIAVVDTGVDRFAPDLDGKLWANPAEQGGLPGVDDDGDGTVDDIHGADFIEDDGDPDDYAGHGTHVAGTAAATADNGIGVAGVAPEADVIAVRVLDGDGNGTTDTVAQGIQYAARHGADAINLSLSGPAGASDPILSGAVDYAATEDSVVVAAAGNEGVDNETTPSTPCNLTQTNLLCVAAITNSGALAGFSNYGATSVDLAAPGQSVISVRPEFEVLATDGFDSGLGAWTAPSPWGTSTTAFSGLAVTDSPGGTYANNADQTMVASSPLDLTERLGCRVDLKLLLDTNDTGDRLYYGATDGLRELTDYQRMISTGGAFKSVGLSLSASTRTLTSFDGSPSVKSMFRFVSNARGQKDGAYVDDSRLTCRASRQSPEAGQYAYLSGTSMATPHVSGAVALVRAAKPSATPAEIVAAVRATTRPLSMPTGKQTVTNGLLDAGAAVARIRGLPAPGPTTTTPPPSPAGRGSTTPTAWPDTTSGTASGGTSGDWSSGAGSTVSPTSTAPVSSPRRSVSCRGRKGRSLRRCRLKRKIARTCGRKRGRARRVCSKRVVALDRCSRMSARTGKQKVRKRACVRRAKKLGKRRSL